MIGRDTREAHLGGEPSRMGSGMRLVVLGRVWNGESSGKKGKRTSSRIELCSGVAGGVRGGVALPLPVAAFSRPPLMPAGSSFVGVGGGVASAFCRLAAASLAPIDSV